MNNKKVKKMIESITGAKFSHLHTPRSGAIDSHSKYCLRKYGMPVSGINRKET